VRVDGWEEKRTETLEEEKDCIRVHDYYIQCQYFLTLAVDLWLSDARARSSALQINSLFQSSQSGENHGLF
jgi:hypothetical protein